MAPANGEPEDVFLESISLSELFPFEVTGCSVSGFLAGFFVSLLGGGFFSGFGFGVSIFAGLSTLVGSSRGMSTMSSSMTGSGIEGGGEFRETSSFACWTEIALTLITWS